MSFLWLSLGSYQGKGWCKEFCMAPHAEFLLRKIWEFFSCKICQQNMSTNSSMLFYLICGFSCLQVVQRMWRLKGYRFSLRYNLGELNVSYEVILWNHFMEKLLVAPDLSGYFWISTNKARDVGLMEKKKEITDENRRFLVEGVDNRTAVPTMWCITRTIHHTCYSSHNG